MATKAKAAPKAAEPAGDVASAPSHTPARVLVACSHGRVNQVVALDASALAASVAAGEVDPNPSAVAYALSLGTP
jgi:hypothetical protein